MKARQLKNSILQYAMQGKLVAQNPSDEPASVLLEQINEEKEQLIKDRVIKREKQLSPITDDEIPYDIPDSWEWIRLKDISIINPKNKADDKLESGFVPMKMIDEGFSNNHIFDNKVWGKIKKGYTHFQNNDIAIAKITPCFENKKSMILKGLPNNIGAGTTELFIVRPYKKINLKYLLYLFKTQSFIREGVESFTGTAGQQRVSKSFLENYLIGLPPLAEQQRIIAKIEELFKKVDEYDVLEQEITSLNFNFPKEMEKSILQYAMQGKLVKQDPNDEPASMLLGSIKEEKEQLIKDKVIKREKAIPPLLEEEIPFDIPKSWKWVKLSEVSFVTKLAGFEYTKYIAPNIVTEGVPLFKGKNIKNSQLVLEFESYIPIEVSESLNRSQLRKKCLLTPYVGTIGNIAIFEGDFKAHLGANVGKIELFNPGNRQLLLEEYVLYYLKSSYGYAELTKYKKATAQESISIDAIRNVIIPIPPINEQKRIVDKIEEMNELTIRMKNNISIN
ncbi:restriction endonuclease subunit S [Peribacillus butanolivorans]